MIELRVVSGGHAGVIRRFDADRVTVGRDPTADLQLHPVHDLETSAHHAALALGETGWFVRDLGSKNGTWVNGQLIDGDHPLSHGDRLQFGADGPVVTVHLEFGQTEAGATVAVDEAARTSTEERVRLKVARETRRIRLVWGFMALGLAVLLYIAVTGRNDDRARWEAERSSLLSRVDSALESGHDAASALEGRLSGLESALDASRGEVTRLRAEVSSLERGSDPAELETLRGELLSATQALRRQQLAASLDFEAIEAANRHAVALVYVETLEGDLAVATGFAVRPDGTLITNRHIFGGESPPRPRRVAVQFADSRQVFPARVVAASELADLAVIRVDNVAGSVPVVRGMNVTPDTVEVVATIGFPLGAAQAVAPGDQRAVDPLMSAGVILARSPDRIEIQGYGAQGASGSPVFDGGGSVIGVVYGGQQDGSTPLVLAVPASEVVRLLERIPR